MAMEGTGLGPRDPHITSAKPLEAVLPDFKGFVENLLQNESQKGVMVAWGGKGCDAEWLFRVTEVEHPETLQMPKGLDFFIDPCHVIGDYKSCGLNENKRGDPGHGLKTVGSYIKSKPHMEGAHD